MKLSKEDFSEDKKIPLKVRAKCFCLEFDSIIIQLEHSIFSTDYYKQEFEGAVIEEVDVYYYGDVNGEPVIGLEYGEYDDQFLCTGEGVHHHNGSEDIYQAWSFVSLSFDVYDCIKVYEIVNSTDQIGDELIDESINSSVDGLVIEI